MKNFTQLFVISAILLALPSFGFAETKIAVIDLQRAVLTTQFAQQQQKTLTDNAEYKTLVEKLQLLRADLQILEKEANTNGMTWSSEQRAEHANKVKYKSADYQLVGKKMESQRNDVINVIKQQFATPLKEVVNKIIEEEGITLLLNAKATHFVAPDLDITGKVTVALDAED